MFFKRGNRASAITEDHRMFGLEGTSVNRAELWNVVARQIFQVRLGSSLEMSGQRLWDFLLWAYVKKGLQQLEDCATWVFCKGLEWCEWKESIINKTGLKQSHLKHLRVSKEVSARHHYGEPLPRPFLEIHIVGWADKNIEKERLQNIVIVLKEVDSLLHPWQGWSRVFRRLPQ